MADPTAGARHLPPQYHPRSVVLSQDQMGQHIVTDSSYSETDDEGNTTNVHSASYPDRASAQRAANTRKGVIQGALTRRSNKRTAMREAEATNAGVTTSWLREELTQHEADAWLGLDFERKP